MKHRQRSTCVAGAAPSPASSSATSRAGPVVLWFKHDLRLDDHPGLHQALQQAAGSASGAAGALMPVYCFDPARCSHLLDVPGGISGLLRAVNSLRESLRQLGSDLVVLTGRWEEQIPRFAAHMGAASVVAEREVEWERAAGLEGVQSTLPAGVALHTWAAPLFAEFVDNFKELKQRQPPVNAPLDPPESLPALPEELLADWWQQPEQQQQPQGRQQQQQQQGAGSGRLQAPPGGLPEEGELERAVQEAYLASLDPLLAASPSAEALAASDWLRSSGSSIDEAGQGAGAAAALTVISQMDTQDGSCSDGSGSNGAAAAAAATGGNGASSSSSSGGSESGGRRAARRAAWEAELAAELAAGEGPVMAALETYLRRVEADAAGGGSSAELGPRLWEAVANFDIPAAPEGCFPALFTRALALGVVSKRRLYQQAQALLRASQPAQLGALSRMADFLSRLGPPNLLTGALKAASTGGGQRARKAAAALAAAEARDFHEQMAAQRQDREVNGAKLRHWRWRGMLTDYLEAVPDNPRPGAPAILLVHGFGAFSEQWRDNASALAAGGYHVFAPTLPGYGRSEKPSVPYGQDFWRDFVHDFSLHVVRRPVVAVGNSIGGFIAASVASDFPGVCKGLVLVNSAGLMEKGYQPPAQEKAPFAPPFFVANAASQALFAFLQGSVEGQLKRLYPVRPERADAWLAQEISRAAYDPGALGVFRSVFYLSKPRPLSYVVDVFGGPTLMLQGSKDPLNDAVGRAKQLAELCSNVRVKMLNAGHCPHDELPEEVNAELLRFMEEDVLGEGKRQKQGDAQPRASARAG
ncbi:hypothetical protein N2152v2_005276 [Parachlorella kessleri]